MSKPPLPPAQSQAICQQKWISQARPLKVLRVNLVSYQDSQWTFPQRVGTDHDTPSLSQTLLGPSPEYLLAMGAAAPVQRTFSECFDCIKPARGRLYIVLIANAETSSDQIPAAPAGRAVGSYSDRHQTASQQPGRNTGICQTRTVHCNCEGTYLAGRPDSA